MFFQNFYTNIALALAILKFEWSDQLVLGSRGIAGLAWSMISIAGSFWAIRACLAAATPGWFREFAGIRSQATDCAVGMDLELELKLCKKLRANMGEALGISAENRHHGVHHNRSLWKDIYAFDSSTSGLVRAVSDQETKEANIRFCSNQDSALPKIMDRFQQTMLLMSILCKAAELFILYIMNAGLVCVTTALPWGTFVLGGLYLFTRTSHNTHTHDIIAGRLPTSISAGGPLKIVLNIQKPTSHSLSWRVFWILGSVISLSSYALTLYLLSFRQSQIIICWLAFRWLDYYGCNFVHKDGEAPEATTPEFSSYTLHSLPPHLKPRIFDLTLATSRYQSLVHVRRTHSYEDDCFSAEQIISMIKLPVLLPFYPADEQLLDQTSLEVNIVDIIGDTLLSSATWITGSEYTPMDLYDCCVLSFRAPRLTDKPIINVPCARVLSTPIQPKPTDDHLPQIVPKGTPNRGVGTEWIYFIPINQKLFLVLQRPSQFSCKGTHYAQIMRDEEITNMFVRGVLNISLTHVDEVRETIALSHLTFLNLSKLV